ncbi:MAG TPA: segregation/condensation protein A [Dehalococcoidia bacterium]|nr:segregation/condensation protein A [Dehalococcoidia bacterium]
MPQTTPAYQLTLPIFEGPLDLLLHLIEREELDITNIALVAVADQYMAYLHTAERINLDQLAEFIVIGARLLLLKSRALLPRPPGAPLADDEEDESGDLARQLIEYKLFKEAAGQLRAIETAGLHSYPRIAPPPELPAPTGLDGVTLDLLQQLVMDALTRQPEEEEPAQVIQAHRFTVREKVALITELLAASGRVSFRDLIAQCRSRMEIIVSFMAVLELIKSRLLDAVQDAAFADISLVPSGERLLDVEVTSEFDDD